MRSFLRDREGSAWVWAVALISIFGFVLLYAVLLPAMVIVKEATDKMMNDSIDDAVNNTDVIKVRQITGRMFEIYDWYILFMLGGILLGAYVYSIHRESGGWGR